MSKVSQEEKPLEKRFYFLILPLPLLTFRAKKNKKNQTQKPACRLVQSKDINEWTFLAVSNDRSRPSRERERNSKKCCGILRVWHERKTLWRAGEVHHWGGLFHSLPILINLYNTCITCPVCETVESLSRTARTFFNFRKAKNLLLRAVFHRVTLNQNQSSPSNQSQGTQTIQWTNQNLKKLHVADGKRGKTCARESRLVLISLLIGWKIGASLTMLI